MLATVSPPVEGGITLILVMEEGVTEIVWLTVPPPVGCGIPLFRRGEGVTVNAWHTVPRPVGVGIFLILRGGDGGREC